MTLTTALIIIIGLLLLFCAYQQWRHEQWANSVIERLSTPPAPPLSYRELERGAYSVWPPEPQGQFYEQARGRLDGMPFLLERRPDRCTPTRKSLHPIHPRFENYGVDVSIAPTIGVGRLPSYTLLEFGRQP